MCHNREQKIAGHMDAPNLPLGTRLGQPGEAASPDLAEEAGEEGGTQNVEERGKYRKALPFSFVILNWTQANSAKSINSRPAGIAGFCYAGERSSFCQHLFCS